MKIFTYAFSNTAFFFNEVIKKSIELNDDIEWGVIYPRLTWKNTTKNLIKDKNLFYLYENFDKYYEKSDPRKEIMGEGIDNIYKILESSKFAYSKENSHKQLKSVYTIYKIYKEFLLKNKPDFVIFPDLEAVDGLILFNICKELKIETMYCVHTRNLGKSFFAQDYYETLPKYFGRYNENDIGLATQIVEKFEKDVVSDKNLLMENSRSIDIKIPNILIRFLKAKYNKYKYESKCIDEANFLLRVKMNIPKIIEKYRKIIFDYYKINFFDIVNNKDWIPSKYIIFPLQVTPESSINTLAQYFIKQERVIDLIRLNMPSNYYLLLKEHPAMIGKRDSFFYKKIRKKPGCLLVSPYLNTKEFVEKSDLVITVTGTIGLESFFNNKSVLAFGPTFFSHLIENFNNYLELKVQIKDLIEKNSFENKDIKIEEIAKIYNISYDFILHDPLQVKEVMQEKNIENFIDAVKIHINRVERETVFLKQ